MRAEQAKEGRGWLEKDLFFVILGLLLLVGAALAKSNAVSTLVLGKSGYLVFGEAVSGGGPYFIGVGRVVTISDVNLLAVGLGDTVVLSGNVRGDAYLVGSKIAVSGSVNNLYAFGSTVYIDGNVNTATVYAGTVYVSGNIENNLFCDCSRVYVEKGADIAALSGKANEVSINGVVRNNTLRVIRQKSRNATHYLLDWLYGVISTLILYFVLRHFGYRWDIKDFVDKHVYIYGIAFIVFPVALFILFLLALPAIPLSALFGCIFGVLLAAFGIWLVVLFLAGIPVYTAVGKWIGERLRIHGDIIHVLIGFSTVYLFSILSGFVWIFVAIVGGGALLRSLFTTFLARRKRHK